MSDEQPKNKFRKSNYCPYCNHFCDAASLPDNEDQAPFPGALSICIECAKPSVFNKEMILERFDMNTLEIEEHAHVVKIQATIHGVRGRYHVKPNH